MVLALLQPFSSFILWLRSRTALFIGQVWPERTSSAAGVRTADLVDALQSWGWDVGFLRYYVSKCSSAAVEKKPQPELQHAGIADQTLIAILAPESTLALAKPHKLILDCSASAPNEHTTLLQQQGCRTYECAPNREEQFTGILQHVQPTLCIFDR